jgi:hypothetical protein
VWGRGSDLVQTSIIRRAYESFWYEKQLSCQAWVRLMHPFNPKESVQSLVEQFHATIGVNALFETEKTSRELADEFNRFVYKKRYLIVINDLSTTEEWDWVKRCFRNNNMGSRIIVSTPQYEVAILWSRQENIVSVLKQLSDDHKIYAFHETVILIYFGDNDVITLFNIGVHLKNHTKERVALGFSTQCLIDNIISSV